MTKTVMTFIKHVMFGHYLADLHSIDDEKSDLVADTIADMITN